MSQPDVLSHLSLIISKTYNVAGLTTVRCIFLLIYADLICDSGVFQMSTKHIRFVRHLVFV